MMAQLPPTGDFFSSKTVPWQNQDHYYTRPTDSPYTVEHISPFTIPSALTSVESLLLPEASTAASPSFQHEAPCVSPFSHFSHPDPSQQSSRPSEARAQAFLQSFLSSHPLSRGNAAAVTVIPDAVPTMEELESYGELGEEEGTQRCRRMFKAPVIWDELGHAAWKMLKQRADERERRLADMAPVRRVDATLLHDAKFQRASSQSPSQRRESTSSGKKTPGHEAVAPSPAESRRGSLSMYCRLPRTNVFKSQSWSASSDGKRKDKERGRRGSAAPICKVPSAPEAALEARNDGAATFLGAGQRLSVSERVEQPLAEAEDEGYDGDWDGVTGRRHYKYKRDRRLTLPRMVVKCHDVMRRMFGESP